MAQRGRKTAESLALIDNSAVLAIPRAQPPAELTDEESEVWRDFTNRMPADYFGREHYPMLAQLCRHTVSARHVAQLVAHAEATQADIGEYLKLLAAQERESKAIIALSRTMRMTHQANVRAECSRIPEISDYKPWERRAGTSNGG
jgi:hypothetical protein